jgi:hypothetical protein
VLYVSERTLEAILLQHIADIKREHPCWADPQQLSEALGLQVTYTNLGPGREGAAIADAILLDPTAGVLARQRFTHYHEIVHHLIRANDALYSILADQYRSDNNLTTICERLANVGAAEFVLPRSAIRAAVEAQGWTIGLVEDLRRATGASRVAACMQLALAAPHQCIGVVCRQAVTQASPPPTLLDADAPAPALVLQVDVAASSASTKYRVARGVRLPSDHLLTRTFHEADGHPDGPVARGRAAILFKNNRAWIVECEAIRLGEQVFGLFHLEQPPVSVCEQPRLFPE